MCGIRDVNVQKRLFAEANLTYERAVEITLAAEAAAKYVERIHESNNENEVLTLEQEAATAAVQKVEQKYNKCFRCDQKHNAKQCAHKNSTCTHCSKIGHTVAACFKKKREMRASNTNALETNSSDVDMLLNLAI